MRKQLLIGLLAGVGCLGLIGVCAAAVVNSNQGKTNEVEAVAADPVDKEKAIYTAGEAYCAETAKNKPTVKLIMDKVDQAVELINQQGAAALPKFKGKNSDFIFNGTYIWIHNVKGEVLTHLKYEMVGKNMLGLCDLSGKFFIQEMNNVVLAKGSGWVQYLWPKPGQSGAAIKVSYVKGATLDGKKVVVGCGVYDMTLSDVNAELKKQESK